MTFTISNRERTPWSAAVPAAATDWAIVRLCGSRTSTSTAASWTWCWRTLPQGGHDRRGRDGLRPRPRHAATRKRQRGEDQAAPKQTLRLTPTQARNDEKAPRKRRVLPGLKRRERRNGARANSLRCSIKRDSARRRSLYCAIRWSQPGAAGFEPSHRRAEIRLEIVRKTWFGLSCPGRLPTAQPEPPRLFPLLAAQRGAFRHSRDRSPPGKTTWNNVRTYPKAAMAVLHRVGED